jgi:hypothetical protein
VDGGHRCSHAGDLVPHLPGCIDRRGGASRRGEPGLSRRQLGSALSRFAASRSTRRAISSRIPGPCRSALIRPLRSGERDSRSGIDVVGICLATSDRTRRFRPPKRLAKRSKLPTGPRNKDVEPVSPFDRQRCPLSAARRTDEQPGCGEASAALRCEPGTPIPFL